MTKNRGKRIVELAERIPCLLEQASRLYEKAEKENKIKLLRKKYNLSYQFQIPTED